MENKIIIRIAWYDKVMKTCNAGNWHHFSKLDHKKKWIEEQNKKYPLNYYWIEGCKIKKNEKNIEKYEKNIKCYPNIESFNIEKKDSNKDSNKDWCILTHDN